MDHIKRPRKSLTKTPMERKKPTGSATAAVGSGMTQPKIPTPYLNIPTVPQPSSAVPNLNPKAGGRPGGHAAATPDKSEKSPSKKMASGNRRRRVRCKNCEACIGGDCKLCVYCKDMTKYGGPGRMKQTCEKVSKKFCTN